MAAGKADLVTPLMLSSPTRNPSLAQPLTCVRGWSVHDSRGSYIGVLTPVPPNAILAGGKVFTEVIMLVRA